MRIPSKIKISEEQKNTLKNIFRKGMIVDIKEVTGKTNLTPSEVIALFILMGNSAVLSLECFHECNFTKAIFVSPFEDGFPKVPVKCMSCQQVIKDQMELRFTVSAEILEDIIL